MRTLYSLLFALAACGGGDKPTATEAVCPTPDPMTLTYENFGMAFMTKYCTMCHSLELPKANQRNGAPLYHDYDTLEGVLETHEHVDEYAGAGPAASNSAMPPDRCPTDPGGSLDRDCPQPTEQEREQLSVWLACEIDRPHDF